MGLPHGAARAEQQRGAWTRQRTGTFAYLRAVYFLDQNKGWVVGGNGALLTTSDGGKSWKKSPRPTEDTLHDVYFSDAETGWLVCERSIYLLKEKDEPRSYLLKTTNGGATWTRIKATGKDVDALVVRIIFADGERGWVFGENGALYATADGGVTWARQRVPTRHLLLGGTFWDARQGWLVGGGWIILRTADGGETWREGRVEMPADVVPLTPARLRAVSFVDARRGWAVGAGGNIFTTVNGGYTWRALTTPTEADLYDVKFFDASEGWVVGAGGTVMHTTDGGVTWRIEASGTTHTLERLHFVERTRGWAVGFGGTILTYAPLITTRNARPFRDAN